jgi:DNA-binding response OmpR family regulator
MSSVLIVEDYQSLNNLYADAFQRAGFEVTTARSGSEGLDETAKKEFDIIILDLLMMQLSGMDFLKSFEPTNHPKTKVIVVTNLDSSNLVQKAQSLGAAAYFVKSRYTPKQLADMAQAMLP